MNHPLLTEQTTSDLLVEFFEDLYLEKEQLEDQLKNMESGEKTSPVEERLAAICEILNLEVEVGDPLIKHWEEQVARGEEPDLDMTMDDLRRIKGL